MQDGDWLPADSFYSEFLETKWTFYRCVTNEEKCAAIGFKLIDIKSAKFKYRMHQHTLSVTLRTKH